MEVGVKSVEGMVRTLKLALEENIGQTIDVHHAIFYWLVEHAADLPTKFNVVNNTGLTPYELLKKKPFKGEVYEFGCQVLHRIPGKTRGGDMSRRWLEGTYLGSRFTSGEHIVGLLDGSVVVRELCEHIQRKPSGWPSMY